MQAGWEELTERLAPTPVGILRHGARQIEPAIDWQGLAEADDLSEQTPQRGQPPADRGAHESV